MTVVVTGAAGFIGSSLVRYLRQQRPEQQVISVDVLSYCGTLDNLMSLRDDPGHRFVQADIRDRDAMRSLLSVPDVAGVYHLAAESHVDRSIVDPLAFIRTNIEGTAVMLQEATRVFGHGRKLRFLHVSTDEVFGSLGPEGYFEETTPYAPSSPYSASKASSDHLVRAWHHTYGLPVLVTNCTNNYGPRQYPEKLIPLVITRALAGQEVPVYGTGENVRDWLYVEDHCRALLDVFERGQDGETYAIGGETEARNIDLVEQLLDAVDRERGQPEGSSRRLIRFVGDRPGHDLRYAMKIDHIRQTLGWSPRVRLADGLARTVRWYLENADWCERAKNPDHEAFQQLWYAGRAG